LYNSGYNPVCQEFYVEKEQGSADEYYIRNLKTGYYAHGDNAGTGSIRLDPIVNRQCQAVVFEQVDLPEGGPAWRIKNKHSGYYVHGDDNGTSKLRYDQTKNDICQLFFFYTAIDPNGTCWYVPYGPAAEKENTFWLRCCANEGIKHRFGGTSISYLEGNPKNGTLTMQEGPKGYGTSWIIQPV
jgi:hypothetical protein